MALRILDRLLISSIRTNQIHLVERALDQGADPNAEETPPLRLSSLSILKLARQLVAPEKHPTALTLSAKAPNLAIAGSLLRHGASVDAKDAAGDTALIILARRLARSEEFVYETQPSKEEAEAVRLVINDLLVRRAAVNVRDVSGCTPLWYATYAGDCEVAQALFVHGANPSIKDNNGDSCLHEAFALHRNGYLHYLTFRKADLTLIRLLLDHHVPVNSKDAFGFSPLMSAVSNRQADAAQVLLERGADPGAVDCSGKTALDIASNNRDTTCTHLIASFMSTGPKIRRGTIK